MPIARTSCIAIAIALLGCSRPSPPPTPRAKPSESTPELGRLDVRVSGCRDAPRASPECVIGREATLHLWIASDRPPRVRRGDELVPASSLVAIDDGYGLVLAVRPEQGRMVIEVEGARPWALPLREAPPTPTVDAVRAEAVAESEDPLGRYRGALARLDAVLPTLDTYERIEALGLMIKLRHKMGDTTAASTTGTQAIDEALDAGRLDAAIDMAQILVHIHAERGDEVATTWLLELQALYIHHLLDEGREALWHYYRGAVAQDAGDLREALVELQLAEQQSRRLQLADQELSAASLRAGLLGLLGRRDEQAAVVTRILELLQGRGGATRCLAAGSAANTAWAILMATPPGTASPQAARLLEFSLEQYTAAGVCDVSEHPDQRKGRDDAAVTHALEALWRNDLDQAERRLAIVDERALVPSQRASVGYVHATIAHRTGRHADARARLRLVREQLADGTNLDPLLAWRVAMLEGEILTEQGDRRAAIEALVRAEHELDRMVGLVGLDQGREGLVASLGRSAQLLVQARLAEADPTAALEAARRSRGRSFRPIGRAGRVAGLSPADRRAWQEHLGAYRARSQALAAELAEAWKLPADERAMLTRRHRPAREALRGRLDAAYAILTASRSRVAPPSRRPGPGEAWLVYHPVPGGWVGFALRDEHVHVERLGVVDPGASAAQLSAQLVRPFEEQLAGAQAVVVLPTDQLLSIEFAALPYGDGMLVDAFTVAYAIDLPARDDDDPPASGRALVVGDPASRTGAGRLPQARAEAEAVAEALRGGGWQVELLTDEAATYDAVTRGIDGIELLHYAGHGRRGSSGWASELPLVGEAALGVGDVLAAPSGPRRVVLTGCDTGHTDLGLGQGGMHLAAAFLIGGADLVVAASDVVPDPVAEAFGAALYSDVGAGSPTPADIRRAQRRLRERFPAHWTLFRTWVP